MSPTRIVPRPQAAARVRQAASLAPLAMALLLLSEVLWPFGAALMASSAGGLPAALLASVGRWALRVVGLTYLGRLASRERWWPAAPIAVAVVAPFPRIARDLTLGIMLGREPLDAVRLGSWAQVLGEVAAWGAAATALGALGWWLDRRILGPPRWRPLATATALSGVIGAAWMGLLLTQRPPGPDTYVPPPEDVEAVRAVMERIVAIQRGWIGSRGFPGEEVVHFVDEEGRTDVDAWLLPGNGWAAVVGRKGLRPWGCVHWDTRLSSDDPALSPPETPRGRIGPKRTTTCDAGG